MKKYIIPSSIVLLIVVGVLLVIFKNTSDEQSVQTNIQEEEIKTETQTKTNTGELTTDDILSQLDEQVEVIEPEVDENNEPEIVPEPEPKVEPVIVEKPKPVVVPEPKPVVATTQPDFQPHEYYQRIPEIAPIIHDYKPKSEWFIPDGNPEDFSMDNFHDLGHAYGVNIKRIYITINKQYIETPVSTLEGMTSLLKQYISQDFYFVGDNEEESQLRSIHVNVKSLDEANQLIKEMKKNVKILNAYNGSTLLPQFKDRETEIEAKSAKFSEL